MFLCFYLIGASLGIHAAVLEGENKSVSLWNTMQWCSAFITVCRISKYKSRNTVSIPESSHLFCFFSAGSEDEQDEKTFILAIGIAVFLVSCLVILSVAVCIHRKKKSSKHREHEHYKRPPEKELIWNVSDDVWNVLFSDPVSEQTAQTKVVLIALPSQQQGFDAPLLWSQVTFGSHVLPSIIKSNIRSMLWLQQAL